MSDGTLISSIKSTYGAKYVSFERERLRLSKLLSHRFQFDPIEKLLKNENSKCFLIFFFEHKNTKNPNSNKSLANFKGEILIF